MKPAISVRNSPKLRAGDHITIAGCFAMKLNPDRRWWQLWKRRYVADNDMLCALHGAAVIEVLRQSNGSLLISAGIACVETEETDAAIEQAVQTLADASGFDAQRIRVHVARFTLSEAA